MAVTKSATKLAKPYKEFPLFAHPNGQWAKKINGKPWYFGNWEDHETVLHKYPMRLTTFELEEIRDGRTCAGPA